MIIIPSKKTIDDNKPKFPLLPQDYYQLKILELKEEKQKKYRSDEIEDVVNITFEIISLKDGSEPLDVDEGNAAGRRVFTTIRPNSIGFMKDGTPSRTRQLIAYTTNQDVFEELKYESWTSFKDQAVNAELVVYLTEKGEKRNKISKFLPQKKKTLTETLEKPSEEIPIIEDNPSPDDIDVKDIPF